MTTRLDSIDCLSTCCHIAWLMMVQIAMRGPQLAWLDFWRRADQLKRISVRFLALVKLQPVEANFPSGSFIGEPAHYAPLAARDFVHRPARTTASGQPGLVKLVVLVLPLPRAWLLSFPPSSHGPPCEAAKAKLASVPSARCETQEVRYRQQNKAMSLIGAITSPQQFALLSHRRLFLHGSPPEASAPPRTTPVDPTPEVIYPAVQGSQSHFGWLATVTLRFNPPAETLLASEAREVPQRAPAWTSFARIDSELRVLDCIQDLFGMGALHRLDLGLCSKGSQYDAPEYPCWGTHS